MRQIKRGLPGAVLLLVMIPALAGCGYLASAGQLSGDDVLWSILSEAQARAMAGSALSAMSRGDFAGYSRDWAPAMKAAITEADFAAWRAGILQMTGGYLAINRAVLDRANTPGDVTWVFDVACEKGVFRYTLTFKKDDDKIAGAFLSNID